MENPVAATEAANTTQATHAAPGLTSQTDPIQSPRSGATQNTLPSALLPDGPSAPLRDSVGSASEIPNGEIKAAIFGTHMASEQYVEHHRKALDSLRESHRQERQAWNIERKELHRKLADLEAKVKRIQDAADNLATVSSIKTKLINYSIEPQTATRSASTPGDFAGPGSSFTGMPLGHVGEEHGTRTLSGMQSIPEESDSDRARSVSFAAGRLPDIDINRALDHSSIAGHIIDKDLDGINLKAASLSPSTKRAVFELMKSDSPSPVLSPGSQAGESSSIKGSLSIEIAATKQVLHLQARDALKHGAGHTPLARLTDYYDTSGTETAMETTPKGAVAIAVESDRPPLEPRPSTIDGKPIRPPTERSDSYFNVPVPAAELLPSENQAPESDSAIIDDDPELTGPLSMPNQPALPEASSKFLDALSEKLTAVEEEQKNQNHSTSPHDETGKPSEWTEPPLRFRQSINFGRQLGQGPS